MRLHALLALLLVGSAVLTSGQPHGSSSGLSAGPRAEIRSLLADDALGRGQVRETLV